MSATVDKNCVAGNGGGVGQVHDCIGDILYRRGAAHRGLPLHLLFGGVTVHRRVTSARRDSIHAYTLLSVLHGQVAGYGIKPALGHHGD